MAIAKTKPRRAASTGLLIIGATLLIGWCIILATAIAGGDIEKMGQFGDAFAPVTAVFAWLAAVGAVRSYEAQRQQLDDERERTRQQRFDELFFRLLDYYESTVSKEPQVQPSSLSTMVGRMTGESLRQRIRRFYSSTEQDGSWLEADAPANWGKAIYGDSASHGSLAPLADQIVAMTGWLQASRVENVSHYGNLLRARLSTEEVWFWRRALAATNDGHLINFSSELGLAIPPQKGSAG